MPTGLTVKLPLQIDPDDSAFGLIKDYKTLIQQNLKNLLLTNSGERIMDINFGVGIRNYLFENMDEITFDDIRSKVIEQVSRYMPFIQIDNVEFNSEKQTGISNSIHIRIFYTVLPFNTEDILSLTERVNEAR